MNRKRKIEIAEDAKLRLQPSTPLNPTFNHIIRITSFECNEIHGFAYRNLSAVGNSLEVNYRVVQNNSCDTNCRLTKERTKQEKEVDDGGEASHKEEEEEVPTQDDEMAYLIIT